MNPQSVIANHSADSPSVSGICSRVHQRVESAEIERRQKALGGKSRDQDRGKGATEQDSQNEGRNQHAEVVGVTT